MAKPLHNLTDSELAEVAKNAASVLTAAPADYGAEASDATALDALIAQFRDDLIAQRNAESALRAATAKKRASRAEVLSALRTRRNIAKALGSAPSAIAKLGIPTSTNVAPASMTVPFARVDTSMRYGHKIIWHDAASAGNRRRPRGVMGVEIWVKVGGDAPGNEKDCRFLTIDASTSFQARYEPDEAGKMAHYMLRWRCRDGSVSAWGETVSATITG